MTEQTDARMIIGKWLNEQPNREVDRVALAELCVEIDALRKEIKVQSYWGMRWEQEHEINISLRKELEQVKMREVVYIDLLCKASESIGDFVSDHGWTMVDMNTLDAIDASLSATSEQVK